MIKATYPIIDSKEKLIVVIEAPESDPESKYSDFRCKGQIECGEYKREFYAYGIDELQCVWVGLKKLKEEIETFEETTNQTCEYTYFEEERFLAQLK